jgi:hypothetical protein
MFQLYQAIIRGSKVYIEGLNRLHKLPITQDQKQPEMNTIHQIARKNGYPITIIDKLNKRIINNNQDKIQNNSQTQQNNKKWITFKYCKGKVHPRTGHEGPEGE